MLIAALDSTAVTASAAVAEIDDNGGISTYSLFTVKNKLTHSETLLPMLDSALGQYGAKIGDVGLIAVSVGPGSFTGVRIGVATAKGLATPGNIPCAAVSTLEAIAENVRGWCVCALMDARRDQFYNAIFVDGKRITDDAASSAEEIYKALTGFGSVTLCGDGAAAFKAKYQSDARLVVAPAASVDQNALSVALCGWRLFKAGETVGAAGLKPVYLRLPQAERERLEKEKQTEEKQNDSDRL